ncbi:hypothetical protein ACH4PU_30580 [Streptomyces sp. NPDC021100]|uniref:hypothetical protein n=1 Tax=Streptomyces sp. NPDC021100 TaxID=3365114 RepID=UPI0037B32E37
MSITEFRQARREDEAAAAEQSRRDRELDAELVLKQQKAAFDEQLRIKQLDQEEKDAEAERRRKDKDQEAAARLQREEAEAARKSKEKKDRQREKERQAKEKRQRWMARMNAAPSWLAQHLDLAAALAVMACSIVPALLSQASSLSGTGLMAEGWTGWLLVFLLPVMLECSAWAATAGEAKAMKQQRNPWPYRVAIYGFAGLAAAINYSNGHNVGGDQHGMVLGSVLGASSVIPVMVWQLVQLGRHREYRQAMKEARQTRKDVQTTREERQRHLKEVWETAVRLRAIAGHDQLSEEDAWQAAYGVHEGAGEVLSDDLLRLLSADMLGLRVRAEERLAVVWEELTEARAWRLAASGQGSADAPGTAPGESANGSAGAPATPSTQVPQEVATGLLDASGRPLFRRVSPQINPSVPPPVRTNDVGPARKDKKGSAGTRKPGAVKGVRRLSPGARKAAAATARTASADENADIEQWIRGQLQQGREPKAKDVGAETQRRRQEVLGNSKKTAPEPGKTWCYDRIAAAKKPAARPPDPELRSA